MKHIRHLWVMERILPSGQIVADEKAFDVYADARRHAKSTRHWEGCKTRVVKYVPERGEK